VGVGVLDETAGALLGEEAAAGVGCVSKKPAGADLDADGSTQRVVVDQMVWTTSSVVVARTTSRLSRRGAAAARAAKKMTDLMAADLRGLGELP
jgi:hypothetical protein